MVNKERLLNTFMDILKINSPSFKERPMADYIKKKLDSIGLEVYEDEAGSKINGNAGNLICNLPGNKLGIDPLLFCAHMDTVRPTLGMEPVLEGETIRSNGVSVLGADDKAGIAAMLEAITVIRENKINHGNIQFVFTIAEEAGLLGSKNLDFERIMARYGFVMDGGGNVGSIIVKTPSEEDMQIEIKGRAAHAGVNPEDGVSAIQVAAKFLSCLELGRIDSETTANIGFIKGGEATNTIPALTVMRGEIRSFSKEKIKIQLRKIYNLLEEVTAEEGASYDFKSWPVFNSFEIGEDDNVFKIAKAAVISIGKEPEALSRGGGSDANIFNAMGIPTVNLGIGMVLNHSNKEFIKKEALIDSSRLILAIIEEITNFMQKKEKIMVGV